MMDNFELNSSKESDHSKTFEKFSSNGRNRSYDISKRDSNHPKDKKTHSLKETLKKLRLRTKINRSNFNFPTFRFIKKRDVILALEAFIIATTPPQPKSNSDSFTYAPSYDHITGFPLPSNSNDLIDVRQSEDEPIIHFSNEDLLRESLYLLKPPEADGSNIYFSSAEPFQQGIIFSVQDIFNLNTTRGYYDSQSGIWKPYETEETKEGLKVKIPLGEGVLKKINFAFGPKGKEGDNFGLADKKIKIIVDGQVALETNLKELFDGDKYKPYRESGLISNNEEAGGFGIFFPFSGHRIEIELTNPEWFNITFQLPPAKISPKTIEEQWIEINRFVSSSFVQFIKDPSKKGEIFNYEMINQSIFPEKDHDEYMIYQASERNQRVQQIILTINEEELEELIRSGVLVVKKGEIISEIPLQGLFGYPQEFRNLLDRGAKITPFLPKDQEFIGSVPLSAFISHGIKREEAKKAIIWINLPFDLKVGDAIKIKNLNKPLKTLVYLDEIHGEPSEMIPRLYEQSVDLANDEQRNDIYILGKTQIFGTNILIDFLPSADKDKEIIPPWTQPALEANPHGIVMVNRSGESLYIPFYLSGTEDRLTGGGFHFNSFKPDSAYMWGKNIFGGGRWHLTYQPLETDPQISQQTSSIFLGHTGEMSNRFIWLNFFQPSKLEREVFSKLDVKIGLILYQEPSTQVIIDQRDWRYQLLNQVRDYLTKEFSYNDQDKEEIWGNFLGLFFLNGDFEEKFLKLKEFQSTPDKSGLLFELIIENVLLENFLEKKELFEAVKDYYTFLSEDQKSILFRQILLNNKESEFFYKNLMSFIELIGKLEGSLANELIYDFQSLPNDLKTVFLNSYNKGDPPIAIKFKLFTLGCYRRSNLYFSEDELYQILNEINNELILISKVKFNDESETSSFMIEISNVLKELIPSYLNHQQLFKGFGLNFSDLLKLYFGLEIKDLTPQNIALHTNDFDFIDELSLFISDYQKFFGPATKEEFFLILSGKSRDELFFWRFVINLFSKVDSAESLDSKKQKIIQLMMKNFQQIKPQLIDYLIPLDNSLEDFLNSLGSLSLPLKTNPEFLFNYLQENNLSINSFTDAIKLFFLLENDLQKGRDPDYTLSLIKHYYLKLNREIAEKNLTRNDYNPEGALSYFIAYLYFQYKSGNNINSEEIIRQIENTSGSGLFLIWENELNKQRVPENRRYFFTKIFLELSKQDRLIFPSHIYFRNKDLEDYNSFFERIEYSTIDEERELQEQMANLFLSNLYLGRNSYPFSYLILPLVEESDVQTRIQKMEALTTILNYFNRSFYSRYYSNNYHLQNNFGIFELLIQDEGTLSQLINSIKIDPEINPDIVYHQLEIIIQKAVFRSSGFTTEDFEKFYNLFSSFYDLSIKPTISSEIQNFKYLETNLLIKLSNIAIENHDKFHETIRLLEELKNYEDKQQALRVFLFFIERETYVNFGKRENFFTENLLLYSLQDNFSYEEALSRLIKYLELFPEEEKGTSYYQKLEEIVKNISIASTHDLELTQTQREILNNYARQAILDLVYLNVYSNFNNINNSFLDYWRIIAYLVGIPGFEKAPSNKYVALPKPLFSQQGKPISSSLLMPESLIKAFGDLYSQFN